MRVTGMDALIANLATLGKRVHDNVVPAMLRAGSKPIIQAARSGLHTGRGNWQRTGALKKSLGVKILKKTKKAVIGPRRGHGVADSAGRKHDPANIGHLVEGGHGGPKAAPPHPFLEPAFNAQLGAAKAAMADKARQGIEKEAAKRAAKGGTK